MTPCLNRQHELILPSGLGAADEKILPLKAGKGGVSQPGPRQQFVLAPHSMARFAFKFAARATTREMRGWTQSRIPLVGASRNSHCIAGQNHQAIEKGTEKGAEPCSQLGEQW